MTDAGNSRDGKVSNRDEYLQISTTFAGIA
jgi:hypothetical protein